MCSSFNLCVYIYIYIYIYIYNIAPVSHRNEVGLFYVFHLLAVHTSHVSDIYNIYLLFEVLRMSGGTETYCSSPSAWNLPLPSPFLAIAVDSRGSLPPGTVHKNHLMCYCTMICCINLLGTNSKNEGR